MEVGSLLDGKLMHGMEITRVGSTGKVYTYKGIDLTKRYFKEHLYFFPIPKDVITINLTVQIPDNECHEQRSVL